MEYTKFKDFLFNNNLDYHSSLMEIFKRYCYIPTAAERGELKRFLYDEMPPTQLNTESIDEYLTRIKVTKSLRKYASDKIK